MADSDTEKWAQKSKQIEAERLKAAKDLNDQKPDKTSLALLDPKSTKVKGWSNDPDVILANTERMGNRALIFSVAGITLALIGRVGGMTAGAFNLGAGGAIISALPSGIGYLCLFAAILLGLIVIGREIYIKYRYHRKLTSSFITALSALVVVIVYYILQQFLV